MESFHSPGPQSSETHPEMFIVDICAWLVCQCRYGSHKHWLAYGHLDTWWQVLTYTHESMPSRAGCSFCSPNTFQSLRFQKVVVRVLTALLYPLLLLDSRRAAVYLSMAMTDTVMQRAKEPYRRLLTKDTVRKRLEL